MADCDPPPVGSMSPATSLGLLERVRARDSSAWERLAELYRPLVLRWCRQSRCSETDASDIQQEVFLEVANRIDQFERQRTGSFRAWLRMITRSKIADLCRRLAGEQAAGGSDAQHLMAQAPAPESLDQDTEDPEETGLLYERALQIIRTDFAESTWRAFWQVVVDGRNAADVALDLGISRNAVYLARARVLGRLRQEFQHLIEV